MSLGPVQLLVLGFEDPNFHGRIREELERLRDSELIRLIDLLIVRRGTEDDIEIVQFSDLSIDEAEAIGGYAGALIGLGLAGEEGAVAGAEAGIVAGSDGHLIEDDTAWAIADVIPENSVAAVALIEHVWAIALRESIIDAGGMLLANEWVSPVDLLAVGLLVAGETA